MELLRRFLIRKSMFFMRGKRKHIVLFPGYQNIHTEHKSTDCDKDIGDIKYGKFHKLKIKHINDISAENSVNEITQRAARIIASVRFPNTPFTDFMMSPKMTIRQNRPVTANMTVCIP